MIMESENAGETGIDKEALLLYPLKEAISARLSSLYGYGRGGLGSV